MINTLHFMRTMILGLSQKRSSEEGATAVEYGLMVALIAGAIIAVVITLGDNLAALFTSVGGSVATNTP